MLCVSQVMLYDDEQGDCITPEDVFERLDDDLAVAGAVVWVGISFEQSASTEYFRKVRTGCRAVCLRLSHATPAVCVCVPCILHPTAASSAWYSVCLVADADTSVVAVVLLV